MQILAILTATNLDSQDLLIYNAFGKKINSLSIADDCGFFLHVPAHYLKAMVYSASDIKFLTPSDTF